MIDGLLPIPAWPEADFKRGSSARDTPTPDVAAALSRLQGSERSRAAGKGIPDAILKRLEGADLSATEAGRLRLRPRTRFQCRGGAALHHSGRRLYGGEARHRARRQ